MTEVLEKDPSARRRIENARIRKEKEERKEKENKEKDPETEKEEEEGKQEEEKAEEELNIENLLQANSLIFDQAQKENPGYPVVEEPENATGLSSDRLTANEPELEKSVEEKVKTDGKK